MSFIKVFIFVFLLVIMSFADSNVLEIDIEAANKQSKVIELKDRKSVEDFVKKNKKFILEIYLPGCHHCEIFKPVYDKLSFDVLILYFKCKVISRYTVCKNQR